MFEKEQFYGNIEYKLFIGTKKNERIFSQFLFRMREGEGRAIYIIGIKDSGDLYLKNIDVLYISIINFLNIIKKHALYKIRIFTKNKYVYSIITLLNKNISQQLHKICL